MLRASAVHASTQRPSFTGQYKTKVGLIAAAVMALFGAVTGCTATEVEPTATEDSNIDVSATIQAALSDVVPIDEFALTFEVTLSENGPEPSTLFIPVGEEVQIVLNSTEPGEFHYKVEDLVPADLLWVVTEDDVREEDVTDDEHAIHHEGDFVPWRSTSQSGIRPETTSVHGYTQNEQRDVIRFMATEPGTYSVSDPLHPEVTGQLTVF